ncbi:barstar family protein [Testudinibacter sp. P80/BLE/0925]|uniref:barstar family protein n=1 Tax=Testudinibacter sp. TW-1 TaxID=3417757 RepID=UPI003D367BA0
MEIILNGNNISCEADFYNELCSQNPDFGVYFGRNLSALKDYIGLLDGYTIKWLNHSYSKNKLKSDYDKIVNIFLDRNENILRKELGDYRIINLILC